MNLYLSNGHLLIDVLKKNEIKIYNRVLSSSIIKDQYSISSDNSKILFIFMFIN